jgi:uncharacterized protein YggU (UPF0235/DUF167 family)
MINIIVKVKTKSQYNKVEKDAVLLDTYNLWTKELPHAGKANQAVVKLIAEYFKTSQLNVTIKKGLKSKTKYVQIVT